MPAIQGGVFTVEFLSVDELARRTNTSPAFWRKRILLREIPVVKVGRLVRLDTEVVSRWLSERVRPANPRGTGKK